MSVKEVRMDPAVKSSRHKSMGAVHSKANQSKPVAQVQATKSGKDHYAKWVKQRVSCAKCSELFDEPHTLVCLHSLCGKCLRGLKLTVQGTKAGYVCPVCHEFSQKDSVRTNFLLTELLHFYVMMTQRGTITSCRQCHRSDPDNRCLDCKADFCTDCKKLHDGFELMRVSHRWISHADIGKRIVIDKLMFCEHHPKNLLRHNCLQCDELVCESCLSTQHASHANETIDHAVKRIKPEMQGHQSTLENSLELADSSIKEIQARSAEICSAVEKQAEEARKIHRKQMEKLNADLIQLLNQFEELKSETKRQGQVLIADIEQEAKKSQKAVSCVDTTMRIAHGASMIQEFQSGVQKRVKRMTDENKIAHLPKANSMYDHQVVLIPHEQRQDDNNKIGHIVSKNRQQSVQISNQWSYALKDLGQRSAIHASTVKLGDGTLGRHFLQYNGDLWIPVTSGDQSSVKVFTNGGEELHTIALPAQITHPNALVQTKTTQASLADTEFAAIASDTGLYTITTKAYIVQYLDPGAFSDVCLYDGRMYALEYKRQQVLVYEFLDTGWTQVNVIEVKHAESGINDTLSVCGDKINVGSWWGDEIHSYSLTGDKVSQYKEKKPQKSQKTIKKQVMRISNPRLSGSDVSGAIVFCDSANRRIQTLSGDGQWGVTVLQGLSVDPVHVIPKGDGSILILGADNSLVQFNFE